MAGLNISHECEEKREIKTFDDLSFLPKLKLRFKSSLEKLLEVWERANDKIRPISIFMTIRAQRLFMLASHTVDPDIRKEQKRIFHDNLKEFVFLLKVNTSVR